jgi:hypothetical protein
MTTCSIHPPAILQHRIEADFAYAAAAVSFTTSSSVPQRTTGALYREMSFTPTKIGSKLDIRLTAFGSVSASGSIIFALFKNTDADAIAASINTYNSGWYSVSRLTGKHVVDSLDPITLRVEYGRFSGTYTTYVNRTTGTPPLYGGTIPVIMEVIEYE